MATGGRATRATASGRSAATLERSTVGFGSDDDDAMTRRRSGESRDDGGRAARSLYPKCYARAVMSP